MHYFKFAAQTHWAKKENISLTSVQIFYVLAKIATALAGLVDD
jgi:hypothetical protein